jgi:pimeloyl-ACP methyl ester carboxylesterase
MPRMRVNDVELFYEMVGEGDPLVLVHGSWTDHSSWQGMVPALSKSFRVVTYDRRGHTQSERPTGPGSRRGDEDDLAALLEALDCAPAHVAGNSFGASTVLGLAARRPDLFRSVIVHEPPLVAIVSDDTELLPVMQELQQKIQSVLDQLRAGEIPSGTKAFVEEVALGPGMWEQLPAAERDIFLNNAPTFLDEQQDPDWASIDLNELGRFPGSVLLTQGDQSMSWYWKIIAKLAQALGQAEVANVPGAGHIPHVTHPGAYTAVMTDFLRPSR